MQHVNHCQSSNENTDSHAVAMFNQVIRFADKELQENESKDTEINI